MKIDRSGLGLKLTFVNPDLRFKRLGQPSSGQILKTGLAFVIANIHWQILVMHKMSMIDRAPLTMGSEESVAKENWSQKP